MKTLEISEASQSLASYARQKNGEPLIITSHGKPVVAVVDVRGMDAESIALSFDPTFIQILEKSRRSHRKHGGISSNEMRRRLGIPDRATGNKSTRSGNLNSARRRTAGSSSKR